MRDLKIACGRSRLAKFWSNKTMTFEALCAKLREPISTSETAEEYRQMPKDTRDAIKDKGGFVAGFLRDNRRKADRVECRSMVVYDLDSATPEFVSEIKRRIPYLGCVYSTHSHTSAQPRIRVILPAARDMLPDEHNAVARLVAEELGILEMTDPCSYEPHQLMYWPSCPKNGDYLFIRLEGEPLNPDEILAKHPNWRNCELLPATSRENPVRSPAARQQDPLLKEGVVGIFCRQYTIHDAIAEFLPEIYAPVENSPNRYTYTEGESTAGLVVYENGTFAYSHHATDPAYGKLLNAFDLVRIHRFYDPSEKRSFKRMSEFAVSLPAIRMRAARERSEEAKRVFAETSDDDWMSRLDYMPNGVTPRNSTQNLCLILRNDPALKDIVFNLLTDTFEIKGAVPWRDGEGCWRDTDDAQLKCYLDEGYTAFSERNYYAAFATVAVERSYHPVKQYFDSLPPWDGTPRAETLFTDYLGAEDTPYTRAVCRKTLCAAYMRILTPGIKFDNIPVLMGAQGIGKSTLIAKLGGRWFSDSLTLSDMDDKTAAEKLQGYWIHEIGELAGLRKTDLDKVKSFISRPDDKYRAPYDRRVTSHPRQCVFFGTTNSDGYLRDTTGNRRFWNVKVNGMSRLKPWDMTPEQVDLIWAEVKVLAETGEELYLPRELLETAETEQRAAMEPDEREGLVRNYLETLLPENWDGMDAWARREYFRDAEDPTRPKGETERTVVSNMEIWCECFGRKQEDLQPRDSYAIAAIMKRIEGWERAGNPVRRPIYGMQRVYRRMEKQASGML